MADVDRAALKKLAENIMTGKLTVEEMNDSLDALSDDEYEAVAAMCRTQNMGMSAVRESGYRRNTAKKGDIPVPYGGPESGPISFAGPLTGVELLSVGTHNTKSHGEVTITEKDLEAILAATQKELPTAKPPIKLGHDNKLGDSEPRLGTLTKVYIRGKKLVGDFAAVANTLMTAVKEGRYTRVSVEMHPTLRYLTAVAFLGTAMPAAKNLADIVKLSDGSDGEGPVEWEIAFACGEGEPPAEPAQKAEGGSDMGEEQKDKMQPGSGNGQIDPKEFAALKADVVTLTQGMKTQAETNAKLLTDLRNTKIAAAIDTLRGARKLAPADDAIFLLAAKACAIDDSVKFSGADGKETVGTSFDALVAQFMARPDQWKAGESAPGQSHEKPTDAKKGADPLFQDETPEQVAAFRQKAGIPPVEVEGEKKS
jgi:hypothetical protein